LRKTRQATKCCHIPTLLLILFYYKINILTDAKRKLVIFNTILKKASLYILLFFTLGFVAQNKQVDDLKLALKNAKHDTTRCNILSQLAETAGDEEWPAFNEQLKDLAEKKLSSSLPSPEKKFYLKHLANALNNMGYVYNMQGRVKEAMVFFGRSLKIQEEIGDKHGVAYSLNNIGYMYNMQGQVKEALDYYNRSLKIREEIGDKRGIAESFINIADVYSDQGQMKEALDYHNRSLKISEQVNDKDGMASSLHNIAFIYNSYGKVKEALEYHTRSLKMCEEIGDRQGIALELNSIGVIYNQQGKTKEALDYIGRSLKIKEEINDKDGIANTLHKIAGIYKKQGKVNEALLYASRSLKLAKELGYPESIEPTAELLSAIYEQQGKGMQALEMYKLYAQMRDSVKNRENKKISFKKEAQYKYEKQRAADSVASAKDMQVKNVQIEKQNAELTAKKNQQYFLFGGLGLVTIFAGFMYNRFRVTQKQKESLKSKKMWLKNRSIWLKKNKKRSSIAFGMPNGSKPAFCPPKNILQKY
jgi:tetratricopeptide (TPR) repeat protein